MNKQEFTEYIAENFDCSSEAAEAIIEIFSVGVYLAISEGYEVNVDSFESLLLKI